MTIAKRNNIIVRGRGTSTMLFAHGFGCDQNMWRYVTPAFEDSYVTILFDHAGAGLSDLSSYEPKKYSTLEGYADDIVEIGNSLQLKDAIFVGHSVSAMMGIMASKKAPGMFKKLILVAPSPCYIDDEGYNGGFSKSQINELLDSLESNHLGWSKAMAPAIMGNPERKELGDELTNSFCKTDPEIANQFARTTFLTDSRSILSQINVPSLILQCSDDIVAPQSVGRYMQEQIPNSTLVILEATGHCPNLSEPEETIAAIKAFL